MSQIEKTEKIGNVIFDIIFDIIFNSKSLNILLRYRKEAEKSEKCLHKVKDIFALQQKMNFKKNLKSPIILDFQKWTEK